MQAPAFLVRYLLMPAMAVLIACGPAHASGASVNATANASPRATANFGANSGVIAGAFPSDCSLSLDQSGRIDLGRFPVATLTKAGNLPGFRQMARRSITLTGSCRTARVFALRFLLPPHDDTSYRFGDRGVLRLSLSDARVDGQAAGLSQGPAAGASADRQATLAQRPGRDVVIVPAGASAKGRYFSVRIDLDGQVPTDGIRSELRLAADARIELL